MPLGNWFDTREIEVFVKSVVEDLAGRLPPATSDAGKKNTPERFRNAHEAIRSRVIAFARTRHINWFKKAYLGYAFRNALRELGYDAEFADTWTQDMLVAVSTSTNPGASSAKPR